MSSGKKEEGGEAVVGERGGEMWGEGNRGRGEEDVIAKSGS